MTSDFFKLVEARASGVFRCHAPLPDHALDFARQQTLQVVRVRLVGARDKNAFLNAVAKALQWPDYFGHNWDAFYDCLLDLNHGGGWGTLLVLGEASGFAKGDPEEFAAAVDTLADAAEYWKTQGKVLLAVAELDAPVLAPELEQLSFPAA